MDLARHSLESATKPDINAYDNSRMTALHLASREGKLDFVQLLVNNGAEIDKTTPVGYGETSSLHFAAMNGHYDVVEYLVEHGADVFQKDVKNRTALRLTKKECGGSESKQKIIELLKSKMKSQEKSSDGKESNSPASTSKKRNLVVSSDTNGFQIYPPQLIVRELASPLGYN